MSLQGQSCRDPLLTTLLFSLQDRAQGRHSPLFSPRIFRLNNYVPPANGFSYDNSEWANMGQGAPETGDLPGGPPRIRQIDLRPWGDGVNEYAPTTGVKELRQAVADYYNREYRVGKKSQYTYENVCITPGGRAGMARVAAVIGDCYTNYQIPE
jgi:aspartate/methionine/tyrosine aminotransferase